MSCTTCLLVTTMPSAETKKPDPRDTSFVSKLCFCSTSPSLEMPKKVAVISFLPTTLTTAGETLLTASITFSSCVVWGIYSRSITRSVRTSVALAPASRARERISANSACAFAYHVPPIQTAPPTAKSRKRDAPSPIKNLFRRFLKRKRGRENLNRPNKIPGPCGSV